MDVEYDPDDCHVCQRDGDTGLEVEWCQICDMPLCTVHIADLLNHSHSHDLAEMYEERHRRSVATSMPDKPRKSRHRHQWQPAIDPGYQRCICGKIRPISANQERDTSMINGISRAMIENKIKAGEGITASEAKDMLDTIDRLRASLGNVIGHVKASRIDKATRQIIETAIDLDRVASDAGYLLSAMASTD